MKKFKSVDIEDFNVNPFSKIGKDWMLVTAKNKDGKVNTMTASWGGLGVLWKKNVVFIFIRPQRYTKEFIDSSNEFSLCFFDSGYKKTLSYLGSVSGKDENKIEKSYLTLSNIENIPVFEEAETIICCHNLFKQDFLPTSFLDKSLEDTFYKNKDYHTMYVAEINNIFVS